MTSASEAKLEILANPEALFLRAADWMLELATAKNGVFAVALSGGPTSSKLNGELYNAPRPHSITSLDDSVMVPAHETQMIVASSLVR